ncbi:MAG: hypothetical protein ACI9N1_001322 [Flavobacteriales bacterium]|jgi:hypothetical protein
MEYKELLRSVSFPFVSQVHVAKHLELIHPDFLKQLSFSQQSVFESFIGSKFKSQFAKTPTELITKAIQFGKIESFLNREYSKLELQFSFNKKDYSAGIGWDTIIDISKISTADDNNLTTSERNGTVVNVFKSDQKIETNLLNMILHRNANKWEVTTIFPGTMAPPLPNSFFKEDRSKEEARIFWQNHAFVK